MQSLLETIWILMKIRRRRGGVKPSPLLCLNSGGRPPMATTFSGSPSFLSIPFRRLRLTSTSHPPPRPQAQPDPSQQQQQLSAASTPPIEAREERKLRSGPIQLPGPAPDSTDWIASGLSRRFGLGAGLAWAAFLAVGVISEQVKTRFEAFQEETRTRDVTEEEEVLLPNGIRYSEMRVGGGSSPRQGDLVVIDLKGKVQGSEEDFVNTFGEGNRSLALVLGSRPYTKGMCEGVEYVLKQRMKSGGKARVVIPPNLGFGDKGADLGSGIEVPPNSTLEFIVQVDKVTIAPS